MPRADMVSEASSPPHPENARRKNVADDGSGRDGQVCRQTHRPTKEKKMHTVDDKEGWQGNSRPGDKP